MFLSNINEIEKLQDSSAIALDIGGSLIKVIAVRELCCKLSPKTSLFGSWNISELPFLIQTLEKLVKASVKLKYISLTGGGGYILYKKIEGLWDSVKLYYFDEMDSLTAGFRTMTEFQNFSSSILINVGTGISVLKGRSDIVSMERVSGSAIGGGTYLGLMRIVFGHEINFSQAMECSLRGNPNNCDVLVRDIYQGNYPGNTALSAGVIASCLAKEGLHDNLDIAAGLLELVLLNILQLGNCIGITDPECDIYFSGFFFQKYGLNILGKLQDLNIRRSGFKIVEFPGYLGCIGCLINGMNVS